MTLQVYGELPPVALNEVAYATPTVPAGTIRVVTLRLEPEEELPLETTMLKADCAVLFVASVTSMVGFDVPDWLGVPLTTPVEELRESPAGRDPALTFQAYGEVPPLAPNVIP